MFYDIFDSQVKTLNDSKYFAGFIMVPRLYSPIHFSFSFESLKHLSNAEKQHVNYSMVE